MVINVSQQLKGPVGSLHHHRINETAADPPVSGEVTLLRTDKGIFIKGILNTTVKAVCSRCLSSFDEPLTFSIEEEFLAAAAPESSAFAINEHREIDLTEAVRQYSLLARPMKPLCRKDCAGLCPYCGHNLNLGPCGCQGDALDPRFAPLAKLVSEERTG